jgi:PqqD family protein of HPr-rel-A system
LNFSVSSEFDLSAWQLRHAQKLRVVDGEDESVVYNDCSGETHLLSAIAMRLLQHLQRGQANFSSISVFLAETWEFESEEDLRQITLDLLTELDALSLIEACQS